MVAGTAGFEPANLGRDRPASYCLCSMSPGCWGSRRVSNPLPRGPQPRASNRFGLDHHDTWHTRRDSNPRRSVSKTGTLPSELRVHVLLEGTTPSVSRDGVRWELGGLPTGQSAALSGSPRLRDTRSLNGAQTPSRPARRPALLQHYSVFKESPTPSRRRTWRTRRDLNPWPPAS